MSISNEKPLALSDITNTKIKRKRSGGASYVCCVSECLNKSSNTTNLDFYKFPTSNPLYPHKKARHDSWVKAVQLKRLDGSAWRPTDSTRICGEHFVGNKKSEDPRSPSYNPSLFPSVLKKHVNSEQALARYQRVLKRPNQQFIRICDLKKRKIDITPVDYLSLDANMITQNKTEAIQNKVEYVDSIRSSTSSTKVDCGVQVDFLSVDNVVQDVFICNRYIFPGNMRDAETLCHAPGTKGRVKIELINNNCDESDKSKTNSTSHSEVPSCDRGFHGFESIKKEQALVDLAGVSRATFKLFLKMLLKNQMGKCDLKDSRTKISAENKILIFLMKMKCGLTFSAMGVFFQVHRTTVSRIFYTMLDYFSAVCRNFVKWPEKLIVQETMPAAFQEKYSNCRVIIDATEFCVESPHNVDDQVQFFSHYKKGYRVKVVVGCTPGGYISLVSQSHGGRGTDSQITVASDLINLLEPGDTVLADKGFPQIKSVLDEKGENILLVMPPFLNKDEQFTNEEVEETYSVASVRIHIERIMQRLRTHKILDRITVEMLPYMDKIIFMACVLVNLQRPIIKEKDN